MLADSADSPEVVAEVYDRLHRSVTGMGGILDRWPEAATHAESVRVQQELQRLGDELFELTG
jgi:hypothetical protein